MRKNKDWTFLFMVPIILFGAFPGPVTVAAILVFIGISHLLPLTVVSEFNPILYFISVLITEYLIAVFLFFLIAISSKRTRKYVL